MLTQLQFAKKTGIYPAKNGKHKTNCVAKWKQIVIITKKRIANNTKICYNVTESCLKGEYKGEE